MEQTHGRDNQEGKQHSWKSTPYLKSMQRGNKIGNLIGYGKSEPTI